MSTLHKRIAGRRTSWIFVMLLALFTTVGAVGAYAQSDNGSIVGTITDTTGAFIPNATVTVTNVDTGLKLNGKSNSAGEFQIFAVPRGNYKADVAAQGFQSQSANFAVSVATTQTLQFSLAAGAVSQTVEVTSAAPLVNTTSATMGEVSMGRRLRTLPLNGRNFTGLALLAPGVTRGAYGDAASGVSGNTETFRNSESGGASLSVNGLRPQADNYLLDGLDDNDSLINTILIFPNIDATQEFKIDTSVAPAEYGRAGGAIVASSIKGGTNQFHGSAFEFYRSGKFDANPDYRFLGAGETPNPAFNRNQPGFSIGGPIIKNKLFGFGDYQAFREVVPQNTYFVTVPTALMRTGDFSELLASSPNFDTTNGPSVDNQFSEPFCLIHQNAAYVKNGQLYNPVNCEPIPGNVLANAGITPNAAAINYFNAYPTPTNAGVVNNFLTHKQEFTHYNTFDVRIDWDPTSKDQAFARFSYDNSASTETPELGTLPSGFGTGSDYVHARAYGLGETHIFTPTLVNQLLIGYNRDDYGYQPPFYGDALSASLGIVNANRNIETSGGALIGGNAGIDYTGDYGLYAVPQNTYEISDSVDWETWTSLLQVRRDRDHAEHWSTSGRSPARATSTSAMATLPASLRLRCWRASRIRTALDRRTASSATSATKTASSRRTSWRVNQKLTLQLGVRYDIITRPYEAQNRQASFDVDTNSPTYGQVLEAGVNGVSRSIINNDHGDVAPRVGFAYDVNGTGKEVVRGGYGIFYFPDYGGIDNQLGQQTPFGGSLSYSAQNGYCVTFTGQTPAPGSSFGCNETPQQTTPLPLPGYPDFNPAAPPAGLSTLAVNRNDKNQQIQEWNLQFEQQLTPRDVLDIAYVGTKSDHLVDVLQLQPVPLRYGTAELPDVWNDHVQQLQRHGELQRFAAAL